jgi:hypothetical protein
MNRMLFGGLVLLMILAPLPLGSNREWSWSLCASIVAALTLVWVLANLGPRGQVSRLPSAAWVVMFILACGWTLVQMAPGRRAWHHPVQAMAAETLGFSLAWGGLFTD